MCVYYTDSKREYIKINRDICIYIEEYIHIPVHIYMYKHCIYILYTYMYSGDIYIYKHIYVYIYMAVSRLLGAAEPTPC